MIEKILCWLGFHDWKFTTDVGFDRRQCIHCKKSQYYDYNWMFWIDV